jgi:AraC-like DNA-binding protein
MKYFTSGKEFHQNIKLAISYNETEDFSYDINEENLFKIIYIKEGNGIINFRDKKLIFIAPVVFCLNEMENLDILDRGNIKASSIYFYPRLINSKFASTDIRADKLPEMDYDHYILKPFLSRESDNICQINIGPSVINKLTSLFRNIQHELNEQESKYFWTCSTRSYFFELLFLMERLRRNNTFTDEITITENEIDSDRIILYIHSNYGKKITVNDLAKTFCTNRTTVNDLFKKTFGLSVIAYLIKIRLEISLLLLKNTLLPVNEIIYRTGFNDASHFGKMFKKYTGDSPSDYREKHCILIKR